MQSLAIRGGTPVSTTQVPFMMPGLLPQDIDAANAVLQSGMLRAASQCATLETRFAEASGALHAMTCANGTCALQLAYGALLERGDEVIVPSWTFIATATMIAAHGCTPVFCDVLSDTYQIDPEDIRRKITPRTRAIACTHLYGCPVDIEAIEAIASEHGLKVIYDAAQAHLATYQGKGIGSFGDAVTYSFYATKNLGTGEGGLVTCNDDDLARRMGLLRSHGETDKYLHESIGFNYRMNDITGAIGNSRLDRLQTETDARRASARRYASILEGIPGLRAPKETEGADSAWHLYTVAFDPESFDCDRDEFTEALRAEGVPTAVHYPRTVPEQPCLSQWNRNDTPVASSLSSRVFCIPMHHALTDEHFDIVERALRKCTEAFASTPVQVRGAKVTN